MPFDIEADLLAEGEPEAEFTPGVAGRLPRKRVAGGAFIRDEAGRVLFVEPNYKPTWDIPGGIAEEGESPLDACVREVREELGVGLPVGPLLVVDWVPAHGVWGDGLMFVFDGGVVSAAVAARLGPADPEVRSIRFLRLGEAAGRLRPSMVRRLEAAAGAVGRGAAFARFGREFRGWEGAP